MKKNNKGFTLAELLIVVAIIAVLVAIAIPVFTTQLEKSRETTDIANLRSAYGAATVYAMTNSVADTTKGYDPAEDGAIVDADATATIGQGTKTDGKADYNNLPGGASYDADTDCKNQGIIIEYSNGMVKGLSFNEN